MKTIYLKSTTKTALIADIAQVIEGYNAEIEFSNGNVHGHWIGKIPNETNPETGEVLSWLTGWHANLLVPEDFDTSIFTNLAQEPNSPIHGFA
jgi:hypothetical protein